MINNYFNGSDQIAKNDSISILDSEKIQKGTIEIKNIAENVFSNSNECPELPEEVWRKIIFYIAPRNIDIPYMKGGVQSGLEEMYLSKQLSESAKKEEKEWASKQLVSLKKYRCTTAKEAVRYAIDHQLTGANLIEFPDYA